MKTLEDYGVETRRATPEQLQAMLVAVECGIADPMVKVLLGHAAAVTEERDALAKRLAEAEIR